MSARVVIITDRRMLPGASLVERVAAMLAAAPRGSLAIQLREKDLDGGPLFALARELVEVAGPYDAEVWINDRLDVALAAGAYGVHLPERGLSIADARAVIDSLGRTLAIGCSRHTRAGVLEAAAAGASLIQLGPIWTTPDKGEPLGTDVLALRRELPAEVRLVAVGGIDGPARARAATMAGADAVAVIRAAWVGSAAVFTSLVEATETGVRVAAS